MADANSTQKPKLSDDDLDHVKSQIGLELIRANDLLDMAVYRIANFCHDSQLHILVAVTKDRVRAIALLVGLDPVDDLGIDEPTAEAAAGFFAPGRRTFRGSPPGYLLA